MTQKLILFAATALCLASCAGSSKVSTLPVNDFPKFDQQDRIAIVAHRGFWNCEQAGYSENSLAALQAAIDNGFWGSELDVHLTADGVVIVNHDGTINGKAIREHNFHDFDNDLLPNGQRHPSLDEYLAVAKKDKKITLVLELKTSEPELLDKSIALLKKHKLFKPDRVVFIAFGRDVCERVATLCPKFRNQYLNGGLTPDELAKLGINGVDYGFWEFRDHPDWPGIAKGLGMSTNAWTVDYDGIVEEMAAQGVGAITTNEPLMVRQTLGEREFTK